MAQDIRFAVGSQDEVKSSVWRLWANKDEVYLGSTMLLGAMKISLHQSGICRAALYSKTPRAALATWKRPPPLAPGIAIPFSIVVPPYLVEGPFHQRCTEKKPVHFVSPPDDNRDKVIFSVAVAAKHYSEAEIKNLPRDRALTVIGNVPLKTGTLWLYYYYDRLRDDMRSLLRDYLSGFRIHLKQGETPNSARSANLFWFDTENASPHVVDIRLGTENETFAADPNG